MICSPRFFSVIRTCGEKKITKIRSQKMKPKHIDMNWWSMPKKDLIHKDHMSNCSDTHTFKKKKKYAHNRSRQFNKQCCKTTKGSSLHLSNFLAASQQQILHTCAPNTFPILSTFRLKCERTKAFRILFCALSLLFVCSSYCIAILSWWFIQRQQANAQGLVEKRSILACYGSNYIFKV